MAVSKEFGTMPKETGVSIGSAFYVKLNVSVKPRMGRPPHLFSGVFNEASRIDAHSPYFNLNKKAAFFTMDGILALGIAVVAIIAFSSLHAERPSLSSMSVLAQDSVNVLGAIKVSAINDSWVQMLIATGEIQRPNNTVLEQVGEFWAADQTVLASNLTMIVLGQAMPPHVRWAAFIDNEELISTGQQSNRVLAASRRLVSGVQKTKPTFGFAGKIFLSAPPDRSTSAFSYFGGFVGQGNITARLDLPSQVSQVRNVTIELDAGSDATVYVNGQIAGTLSRNATAYLVPQRWTVPGAVPLLVPGANNITLRFTSPVFSTKWIAGGFIKVDYRSESLDEPNIIYNNDSTATVTQWLPSIDGLVNLYSSFDVPGTLRNLTMRIHMKTDNPSFLTVADKTVFNITTGGNNVWTLTDANFTQPSVGLSYATLHNKTTPFRLASFALVNDTIQVGNADVVVITDQSGSMKKAVDSDAQGNLGSNCANAYTDPTIRRTFLAQCLDKELIDIVMNTTGNRIWLVELYDTDDLTWWTSPTASGLKNIVDTQFQQNGKGKTCLSCAVNLAYDILEDNTVPGRSPSIVLMTDGVGTHLSVGNTTTANPKVCEGFCDTTGACGSGDNEGCTDNKCNAAQDDTAYAVARAHNDLDATIYTIGFGPVSECSVGNETLHDIAEAGDGKYYSSKNVTLLREIYRNISYEILDKVQLINQTATVIGTMNTSVLYPDSYIQVRYTPIVGPAGFGMIPVTIEGSQFGNSISQGNLLPPANAELADVRVTSYSAEQWTKQVLVNSALAFTLPVVGVYAAIGDPFSIFLSPAYFTPEAQNPVTVTIGSSPTVSIGGSPADRLVYTVRLNSLLEFGDVYATSTGCVWTVSFEDGTTSTIKVPADYGGSEQCSYNTTASASSYSAIYSATDALADAAFRLFRQLDADGDGLVDVNLEVGNIAVNTLSVSNVPSLWGPAVIEVRVW